MMSSNEVSAVLHLRQFWRHVPATCGPMPIPGRLVRALREERGLGPDEPVSVRVPRKRGELCVVVVEDDVHERRQIFLACPRCGAKKPDFRVRGQFCACGWRRP